MRHAKRQQLAQDAANKAPNKFKRSRSLIRGLAAFAFLGSVLFVGYQALVHPETPLPTQWNPTVRLAIDDPVTPLTGWKLDRAAATQATCLSVLDGYATLTSLAPRDDSEQCFIRDRVDLRGVGDAQLSPLETRCAIALRTAMWEHHSLQPAAREILGATVTRIAHIGSYNCRALRTGAGTTNRMSTHATADAIDVAGFDLSDGTEVRLVRDWTGTGAKSAFLRRVRDGACDWFDLTLSPDYNRLHADHFHLQSRGWGLCR